ncbi:hypothetical protein K5549_021730, partial [Capra hircus]
KQKKARRFVIMKQILGFSGTRLKEKYRLHSKNKVNKDLSVLRERENFPHHSLCLYY